MNAKERKKPGFFYKEITEAQMNLPEWLWWWGLCDGLLLKRKSKPNDIREED